MNRKRVRPWHAAIVPDENYFWKTDAQNRLQLVEDAKKRPRQWRFALMFTRSHRPESWSVGVNGFGRYVRFSVSTVRNVAGYFVGWRSVERKDGGWVVYDFVAEKDRDKCRAKTLTMAHRFAVERGNDEAAARIAKLLGGRGSATE
jgi:hypothetical protein